MRTKGINAKSDHTGVGMFSEVCTVMHGVRVCRNYEPGFQFQKRADATARTLRHILSNRRVYTPEQILFFPPSNVPQLYLKPTF